ncbi:C2 domain-containing protein [Rubripirellula reticaptiva]|uniref:Uncharacterized protein n=1 Tax=Rubripirellula reticaptiva TaxID=2528013 RepID=A0A5C6EHC2_9BACT|nr:hypothetical protein [Rubripirellula reticaptiva]TWU47071.1 hypothetical protein Poly59_60450 [Rubripirellula reticaptiva]
MQLIARDVLIHRFVPDEGEPSTAVRVTHRTNRTEVINEETVSPRDNLRRALAELVAILNPHPDHIREPRLQLFDEVTLKLPESTQDGRILEMKWNFTSREWFYFVECRNTHASGEYVIADLQLFEEV